MRLEPVIVPPHFAYVCLACQTRKDTSTAPPVADLDGKPFEAYYCPDCQPVVEVKQEAGYWSVYVNGQRMVDRESHTIADRVAGMVRSGQYDRSECAEVARSIRRRAGLDA